MYCFHISLIHLDTIFTDMVAKELDCGLVEGAFFSFEKGFLFSQLLEDL